MKKKGYEHLTNEELLKRKKQLKAVMIAFGIIAALAIGTLVYTFSTNEKRSMTNLLPVFTLPIMFMPLLISFGLINKELKSRDLTGINEN